MADSGALFCHKEPSFSSCSLDFCAVYNSRLTDIFSCCVDILQSVDLLCCDWNTTVPSYLWFSSPQVQLPVVNCNLTILNGKFIYLVVGKLLDIGSLLPVVISVWLQFHFDLFRSLFPILLVGNYWVFKILLHDVCSSVLENSTSVLPLFVYFFPPPRTLSFLIDRQS